MLHLLYIANNSVPILMRNFGGKDIFAQERVSPLVTIVAYCLMPNHIHIVLIADVGHLRTEFIRRLATAYSAYYNAKYEHSGTIWQGKYKSKVVHDENYLRVLLDYVHLNPYSIVETEMTKEARKENRATALVFSGGYEYSSYKEYLGQKRPQSVIIEMLQMSDICT